MFGFRSIAVLMVLSCAVAFAATEPAVTSATEAASVAAKPSGFSSPNPYDARLAAYKSELGRATQPAAAVLLARIYDLREFVSRPEDVTRAIAGYAESPQVHALVRDEAVRYLAYLDVQHAELNQAEAKWRALGYLRQWSIATLANTAAASDSTASSSRPVLSSLPWRDAPSIGPREWADFDKFYPHSYRTAFARTAVYAAAPATVAFRVSADSAFELSVNGEQVFASPAEDAALAFDRHAVAVNLQSGWNTVLLKLTRGNEGPWRFGLRITALQGGGLVMPADPSRYIENPVCPGADCPTVKAGAVPADLVRIAQAANEVGTGSAETLETLGAIERQHARGSSLEHFQAAAWRTPTADRWLAVAGECADNRCVFDALNSALRLDGGNEPARVRLAGYYSARHQLTKARDLLWEAIRFQPGDFVACEALIGIYISAGQNRRALEAARQLEQNFPDSLWVRRKLAGRYLDLGLLDRAQLLATRALKQNFDGAQERLLVMQIARKRRDGEALRAAWEERTRLDPADPAPWMELAEIASGANDQAAATHAMETALRLAPQQPDLRERSSGLMARWGRVEDARQELSQALQLDPQAESVRSRLQLAGAGDSVDTDAEYLTDAMEIAAAARRTPPETADAAIALANVRLERIYADGLTSVRQQQIFYLTTDQAARDYATRSVQYAPASQQLKVLHARVHKRDGRILEAEESGENHVADVDVAMYYDVRARVLRFPALERGDIVELDYRITPVTDFNPYGDYIGGLVAFQTSFPQQLQRYVLIAPAGRDLNVVTARMRAPVVTTRGDEHIYRWESRNIEALPNEPRGPALTEVAPYVNVSPFHSWDELGRWYAELIRPQFTLDAELRETARGVLKNSRTELQRISAIHQFVLRNTHYVAMEFGVYSYKPYPVTQVYARRFGDCKDKASLMIALLRQAGIQAEIALVRTRRLGSVDSRAISVALFNHAIVYVPKYDLWLDGTAEYAGLHELPLVDQGATALTVDLDGRAQLRRIPATQPTDNFTRRTVRAQVLSDGRIQFTGVVYTRGETAPGLRREYEAPERQRDAVRNALAEVFPSIHVDDVKVDGANDLEHPITVEFRGQLDAFSGRSMVPLASSWSPRAYVQQLASQTTRRHDMLLPAPWTAEEELHFALPAGASVDSMPPDTVLQTPFGSASLHYRREGREVVVRTSVQFRQTRITPAEYDAFRDFCRQAERAFQNEVKVKLRG
jgi:transglutaminase-like putative cysteine protease/tetratricopeptide (TPR) repeat protein